MIRKILKITLTVLLSIILLIVIGVLIVAHNPSFYRAVYPGIDDTMSDYPYTDVTVPSDFVTRTAHGINIKGPEEYLNPDTKSAVAFKSDALTVLVLSASEDTKYELEYSEPFSEKDYEHFYKNLGIETPDTSIEKIVYLRNEFNAESCRKLHLKDLLIFNFEAYSKKITVGVETPYFYHGSNFDGLVSEVSYTKRNLTNVMISNPEVRYIATVSIVCDDPELTKQIIAGIDPSAFLAGDVL